MENKLNYNQWQSVIKLCWTLKEHGFLMSSDTDLCRSTSLSYSSSLQYGCARQCTDVLESAHSSIYMCYNQFTFNTILAAQKNSCTGYYSFVLYFNSQGMSLSSFKLLLSCLSRLKMLELLLYN